MMACGGVRSGDLGGALMSGEEEQKEEEYGRSTLVRKERRLGKTGGKSVKVRVGVWVRMSI